MTRTRHRLSARTQRTTQHTYHASCLTYRKCLVYIVFMLSGTTSNVKPLDTTARHKHTTTSTNGVTQWKQCRTQPRHRATWLISTLITQLNSSTRELTSILIDNKENIRKTLQSSAVSFDKLNYTLSTADSAIVLLNTIAQKINTNDNNIGGLLNDKKLYNNLLQSSERVDSLLIDIKKSPRKYFRISIF